MNNLKKIVLLLLISTASISAQDTFKDRMNAYAGVTSYNFSEYNYTLDVNYRVKDNVSLSSWNTITTGRNEAQGFNYSVVSALVNFSDKKRNTFSVGYGKIHQITNKRSIESLIVKLRVKLF